MCVCEHAHATEDNLQQLILSSHVWDLVTKLRPFDKLDDKQVSLPVHLSHHPLPNVFGEVSTKYFVHLEKHSCSRARDSSLYNVLATQSRCPEIDLQPPHRCTST